MILDKTLIKEQHLEQLKKEWAATTSSFPDFLTGISNKSKLQNEEYLQDFLDHLRTHLNSIPRGLIGRKKWKTKTFEMLNGMLSTENILGVHKCMDSQTLDLFQSELGDFLRHARKFSPESSLTDLGQAVRNYTVYAMFAELFHHSHEFYMPAFGYSMLYPFTDNYIDCEEYSDDDKKDYNQMIQDKIEGKEVHPDTLHHKKTCDLLQAIESRYPRSTGTIDRSSCNIYSLLLMMLEAQNLSILQQNPAGSKHKAIEPENSAVPEKSAAPTASAAPTVSAALTQDEVLDISLYKGGVSVLIDGFFVNDDLTDEDLHFYLGFGFFLQLADDLQDIHEDSSNGSLTLFTYAAGNNNTTNTPNNTTNNTNVEMLINRLLHFVHHIMESYSVPNDAFKEFVFFNCCQLIYSSAYGSREFVSKDYLERLESYLPVSFEFLEKTKKSLPGNQNLNSQANYMKVLDELIK